MKGENMINRADRPAPSASQLTGRQISEWPTTPLWRERPFARLEIVRGRLHGETNRALVFTNRNGACRMDYADQRTPGVELLWNGFRTVYEVDCGLRQTQIVDYLPSHDGAFYFRAEIEVSWWVTDPVAIVRRRIMRLEHGLLPHALHRMRRITRKFDPADVAVAEEEINEQFDIDPLGAGKGIDATLLVHLRLDPATRSYAVAMRKVEREHSLERRSQNLRIAKQRHRQDLLNMRIDYYREIIVAGDAEQFALQLAENPEDTAAVIRALREEHVRNRSQTIDFVNTLVSSHAIDRWEIERQVRDALGWLQESTDKVIGKPMEIGQDAVPRRKFPAGPDLPEAELPEVSIPDSDEGPTHLMNAQD